MWHSPIVKAIWLYKCKNQHAIRNPSIKGEKQSAADKTVDIFLRTYSKRYSFRFNSFVYKILMIVSLMLTSLII